MLHLGLALTGALALTGCMTLSTAGSPPEIKRIPCPPKVPTLDGLSCPEQCHECATGAAAYEWGEDCAVLYHPRDAPIRHCIATLED